MDVEDNDGSGGATPPRDVDATAVEDVVRALVESEPGWTAGTALALTGGVRWKPDATRDTTAALHVHLADRLRPYALERLRLAAGAGLEVHVALHQRALYDESLLHGLSNVDARVRLIEDGGVGEADTLLNALAGGRRGLRRALRVSPELRRRLARDGLTAARAAGLTNDQKGRRLEGLLAFLLSQIEDFEVVERNLRTDTEELDLVIAQRATSGRCWASLGAPFVLVECKNWSDKVPQLQLSAFRVKILGRRSTVRLGLMVGINGFTGDAFDQELRFADGDVTIALIGPDELDRWIDALSGDDALEAIVRWAMLR